MMTKLPRLLTALPAAAVLSLAAPSAEASWALNMTPGISAMSREIYKLHMLMFWWCVAIAIVVFGFMIYSMVHFRKSKGAVADQHFLHSNRIEIIWTVVPVLILLGMAIPSFRLLFDYHDMPTPDVTVKATGYQWYWGYGYPDLKIDEETSNILPEDKAKAAGVPYMLATTQPMIVPVNKVVHVLVTGADVIHSFSVPAFGIKIDAVPGRMNETWFKATQTGTFYGQCSQLCGTDHSFMPIEVKVVSQADFNTWVASKQPAPTPAATNAAAPAPGPTAAAAPAPPAKS